MSNVIYGNRAATKAVQDVNVLQVDSTTEAVKVLDYSHAELHSGSHYMYREYHDISKNGVQEHLIITPDDTKWAHFILGVDAIRSSVVIELIEGVTYATTGTLENVVNRNRNFPDSNTVLLYENPTGIAGGTLLKTYYLGAGKNSNGGAARDTEEIILKQNTTYLIRITEQNVQSTVVNLNFDWYEHTNK